MKKREKGLKALQLTMMALGTVIGGSFFLGSSVAIRAAGPSILLGFVFGGVLVYFILYALSEMTVANPDAGSFRTFASNAFGEGAGFVVGWVYWSGMVLAMSSEATAVSILARSFFPNLPIALLGSAVIVGVTLLNLLGANKLSKLESGLAAEARASRAVRASWIRPRWARRVSSRVCTPRLSRSQPRFRARSSQAWSTVPGLASRVASARGARSKARAAAPVSWASSPASSRDGVPPPRYRVSTAGRPSAAPQASRWASRRSSTAGPRAASRVVTNEQ